MLPEYLTEERIRSIIDNAISEDVGQGDVTTLATVPPGTHAVGHFFCKQEGIVAGTTVVDLVFDVLEPAIRIRWDVSDGDCVEPGQRIAEISGPAHGALVGERTALNLLQRMSGIATATNRMVTIAEPYGAEILDTRKTAPGLRVLDKWAVRIGGGRNHRIGLFDMILVKDNHIAVAGGLRPAIQAALDFAGRYPRDLVVEVEVRTIEEVTEALTVRGVDILLLDNMVTVESDGAVNTSRLGQAVDAVGGSVKTEASGNVTLDTVERIAATGVDYISCGALTHSVQALDVSLELRFT